MAPLRSFLILASRVDMAVLYFVHIVFCNAKVRNSTYNYGNLTYNQDICECTEVVYGLIHNDISIGNATN